MNNLKAHFWVGKRVLVTGHTGFKGSWLTVLLEYLGAQVFGYSLPPDDEHNRLFKALSLDGITPHNTYGDICDVSRIRELVSEVRPDIVLHLAAQPLVREAHRFPTETFRVNVAGTASILEASREADSVKSIVVITTDKVYLNREWLWGYRESDELGGDEPYGQSKAMADQVAAMFYSRYKEFQSRGGSICTVRAGNVIGGGDWAKDRLLPDIVRSSYEGGVLTVRYPSAIRPWQHVLEPLIGYLMAAEKNFGEGVWAEFNFGPNEGSNKSVYELIETAQKFASFSVEYKDDGEIRESRYLTLDSRKACIELGWKPIFDFDSSVGKTLEWYRRYYNQESVRDATVRDIEAIFEEND